MKDLNYQLKQLCYENRQGSYATQVARRYMLNQIADQLHEMGFRGMSLRSLKPKHVEARVERWLKQELRTGTITPHAVVSKTNFHASQVSGS